MAARIAPTHTPQRFAEAVGLAAERLRQGDVVATPTETVYGLAANALNPEAVARVYAVKGRPARNPLIVHVASLEMALEAAAEWPAAAERLAAAFWPGPLTLVVGRSPWVPDITASGGPTVALRWPSHPFMGALIRACGFPLAAPSANLAGRISPTTAAHVMEQLGDRLSLIVDGGPCAVGIESTVVDVTTDPPRLLRPGILSSADVATALGGAPAEANPEGDAGGPLRSPGLLTRHYAPRGRLVILAWRDEEDLARSLAARGADPAATVVLARGCIPMSGRFPRVEVIPDDPEAFARALYSTLHRADAAGAEWIVVEAPPGGPAWEGVVDRLTRASAREEGA